MKSGCETAVIYDRKQEEALKNFAKEFLTEVKILAKMYIEHFFKDKSLHCGGRIPRSFLLSEKRVQKVLDYDISLGVQTAYKYLEPNISRDEISNCQKTGEITSDIKLVNDILRLLAKSGIPQQFAGGMMILYLEFVEGISFD